MPVPPRGSHFHGRAGEATPRAHVLDGHDCAGLHGFEASFEQKLFQQKGIAHLHVGPLLLGLFGEFGETASSDAP